MKKPKEYIIDKKESSKFEKGISLIEDAKVTLNGYTKFVKSQKEIGV